jgi:O-antigen/teichoic acid export membrane protein
LFHKVRELTRDLTIYGIGDVAVSAVNFFLLPIYVLYLSETDYGVLAQLGATEVIAKILFRCGLDGSFMRFYYDYQQEQDRRRLASSLFFFLLVSNLVLLAIGVLAAPFFAERLFGWEAGVAAADRQMHVTALRLVLINTFVMGFTFFPFHLLRMQKRAGEFSALTLARSVSTLLLRIVFVLGLDLGVMGVVWADILVTGLLIVFLLPSFAQLIRPLLSTSMLRESLTFGLPRVPHALAQQVIAVGDRIVFAVYRVDLAVIGVYSMGASFALTLKLFLSAFESAWAPFYYATAREPDGRRVFSLVTTYAFAVLALMTAGLCAIAEDLVALMVGEPFAAAADVIPWIAAGVLLQGIYLLTSIGLNLTKNTKYYPVATSAAAGASVVLNVLLIPRYGIVGAAWANAAAYGVQAALAFVFAQRFYPIDYEWRRLARVAASALLGYLVAARLPAMPALAGVLARGMVVLGVTAAVLAATGFFQPAELRVLARLRTRAKPPAGPAETTEYAGEIIAAEWPEAEGPNGRAETRAGDRVVR